MSSTRRRRRRHRPVGRRPGGDAVQDRGHGPRLDRRRRGGARGAVLGRSAGPAGRSRARTLNGAGGVAGTMAAPQQKDRKSVVEGKSVSVRVDLGGRRIIKKKKIEDKLSIRPRRQ